MTNAVGLRDTGVLIGEHWLRDTSGGVHDHVSATTGLAQAKVAYAGLAETDAAVAAAVAAGPGWRATSVADRRRLLGRIEQSLLDHAAELEVIQTLESGVPRMYTGGSAELAANWFGYYAGWADKIRGEVLSPFPASGLDYTLLEPYGVVGLILPWNAPLTILAFKVAAALAAGNCLVLKPSELAPFSIARFAELALDAGLPLGVLNVVPGGPVAGARLVEHTDVAKVSFTGGIATGRKVAALAAEHVKPVALELGGKSANLLFADADLDAAVGFAAVGGAIAMSGQGCACPTRLLVERPIYDDVLDRLVRIMTTAPVGDPLDEATAVGPVVTEAACQRILGIIDEARRQGSGELLTGGGRVGGDLADGWFVEPTVFAGVDHRSRIAQEEIFGPVLSVLPFDSEDEAVRVANGTDYGLAAYVNTADLSRAHRLAARLCAGKVHVNGFDQAPPAAPLGGMKTSGYGREGGEAGLLEYLQVKNVFISIPGL